MAYTEIRVSEVLSGLPQAPDGPENRVCFVTEHASLSGFKLIDCSTDIEETFGAGDLAEELKTSQANGGQKFWAAVYCLGSGELVSANVADIFEAIAGYATLVSIVAFMTDTDATFADAVKTAVATQKANKKDFIPIMKYREAYSADIGEIEATQNAGTVTIDIGAANDFATGMEILIVDGGALSGRHTLTDDTDNTIAFAATEATYTLPVGAMVYEHPDDYVLAAADEFDEFSLDDGGIVVPMTQKKHVGAYIGRTAKINVHVSSGRVADGGLVGVDTDSNYKRAHLVALDTARFIFFKRFPEDPTQVYVNDDNTMYSATSDVTTIARRRVINKAIRLVRFYAFPLINDHKYPKDSSGAMAAAEAAAEGLKEMKRSSPVKEPEISDYEIEAGWIENGLSTELAIYDINRIKIFDSNVSITNAKAA